MGSWRTRVPVLVVFTATAAAVLWQPLTAAEATAGSQSALTSGLPQASCSLVLQGYGWGQPGVQHCSVSCTPDAVVSIAFNTSSISCQLYGVSVANAADCLWESAQFVYGGHSAVLSFCGRYQVQLVAPAVQSVWLPTPADPSTEIAVLGFGGQVQASISQGRLGGNNGSALLLTGAAHLQLQNKTFVSNNTARAGAGVLVLNGSLHVTDSTLSNNSAVAGGAVLGVGNATVQAWNSSFEQNNASSGGGAVLMRDSAQLQANWSTFRNNSAVWGGAVFGLGSATIQAWNSSFEQNNASSRGGAAYVRDLAQLQANWSTFWNNSAVVGGAVEGIGSATIQAWNSSFEQNNASNGGGGAVFVRGSAQLQVNLSTFQNNSAVWGGAVWGLGSATIQAWNSSFEQNSASSEGGAVGMGVSAQLQANWSSFRNNSAVWGGAVAGKDNATVQAWNSSFEQNSASSGGGAAYVRDLAQLQANWSTFWNNSAVDGGAVFGLGSATIQAWNSSFEQNNASSEGGAVYVQDSAQLQINLSTFRNNSAVWGGAVEGEGNVAIQAWNSSFEQNNASSGGAVYVQDSVQLQINLSTFRNNSAVWGGAVEGIGNATIQAWNSSFEQNNASKGGGAVVVQDSAQLQVNRSMFRDNSAIDGGAVWGIGSATIQAWNSSFEQNNASSEGGAVYVQDSVQLLINLSTFRNNSAVWGGAVEGEGNVAIQAWNSSFEQNNASNGGGAVYVQDSAQLQVEGQSYLIHNTAPQGGAVYFDGAAVLQLSMDSTISKNHATGMGGGLYMGSDNFKRSEVQSPAVQGNTAGVTGQDVAVRPQSLALVDSGSFVTNFNNRAGAYLPAHINVLGSHDLPCGGVLVQAMLDNQWPVGLNKTGEDGFTTINIKVQVLPGAHQFTFSLLDNSTNSVAVATLLVRGCVPGEVSQTNDTCEACPNGKFSLNPSNSSCDACPANAVCPGKAAIVPQLGFWHSSATSIQLHKCPNPKACTKDRKALEDLQGHIATLNTSCTDVLMHSYTYSDEQCIDGYHGNLCGQCRDGYGTSKAFTCRPCFSQSVIIGLYVVAAVVMLAFMKLICHCNTGESSDAAATDAGKSRPTDLLKQLVLYMQYMLVLASMNIPWPVTLSIPLRVLAVAWAPTSPETLTVECLMGASSVPAAIRKTLFYLCSPVAVLLLLLLLEVALACGQARNQARAYGSIKDRMLGSAMVATFLFIPSVARTTLSLFACVPLDKATSEPNCAAAVGRYWVLDMGQRCFEGYHAAWAFALGIPMLFVLAVALPLGMSLFLWHNRHQLTMPRFSRHYGFLYRQYRPSCCYWEAVVVLQTLLLVAAGVFGVTLGPYYQAIIMNAVLALVFALLLVVQPHLHQQTGTVALQSIACLLLTGYITQSLLPYGVVDADDTQFKTYGIIMGVVVLLVNLAFLASVLWQLFSLLNWSQWWAGMCAALQQIARALPHCCFQRKQSQQQQPPVRVRHDVLPTAGWFIKGMKASPSVESTDAQQVVDQQQSKARV